MGLAADNRIRRPAEFRQVLSTGRRLGSSAGDRLLLVAAMPNAGPVSRIGLSVSRRVGGSVTRNRVKRRLREIFREIEVVRETIAADAGMDTGRHGWDVVATARPAAASATYAELRESASRLLAGSKARSGR